MGTSNIFNSTDSTNDSALVQDDSTKIIADAVNGSSAGIDFDKLRNKFVTGNWGKCRIVGRR